jgi:plasmid stabilization system protein ParE
MILLSPDAVLDVERLRTFLDHNNPNAARRALASIWTAIGRLQEFPTLGTLTEDANIHQIVIRFGASGYIVRYVVLAETGNILVTRICTVASRGFENPAGGPDGLSADPRDWEEAYLTRREF